jgi:hypothetical protein
MGCCSSRAFLSIPEETLRTAEETLGIYSLPFEKANLNALKGPVLNDEQLQSYLNDLGVPSIGQPAAFYASLKGSESGVKCKLLLSTLVLCSDWEEPTKSRVLFEGYVAGGEALSLESAKEMVEDIYHVTVECLALLTDDQLVVDYLASLLKYKEAAVQALLRSLFSLEEGQTLTLEQFEAKFRQFRVKFLTTTDARISFKRGIVWQVHKEKQRVATPTSLVEERA